MLHWKKVFTKDGFPWLNENSFKDVIEINSLEELYALLNAVHIRHCLVKPYQTTKNYPLVEARELLPSFDNDMWEYSHLPGFALVAFDRPLNYLSESFQYDIIHPVLNTVHAPEGDFCPLEEPIIKRNVQTIATRLPRAIHKDFRENCGRLDTSLLDYYPSLMPYLLKLDRAQVMSTDNYGQFHLTGIFASFPSDIDNELKRFGMRVGKFVYGDNDMYERNRMFVYQYLMELYGFPVVSERRTSSALFARRLQNSNEKFLLRVLGQTDRTITTYIGKGDHSRYPMVEKIALIRVDTDQVEALQAIEKGGYFLDEENRVVIIRVTYLQHAYDPTNVRQDRALSVSKQEVLHPLTGMPLEGLNIIRDSSNMFLRLNDIVRGEYSGRIIYKRNEVIEDTDTEEKRIKFLYSWLTKHQRRIISYSDDFFAKVEQVVTNYLQAPEKEKSFNNHREAYHELQKRFSYIQQARKVQILEELRKHHFKGVRIGYYKMTCEAIKLLSDLSYEIVNFFPSLVDTIINIVDSILADSYILRNYVNVQEDKLSQNGLDIRKNYRRIVALRDVFISVRKARTST